jgi:hypothetical protein
MPQRYTMLGASQGEDGRRVGHGFASLGFPLLIPDPSPSFHLTPLSGSCKAAAGAAVAVAAKATVAEAK